jgi:hypothetical protein
VRQNLVVFQSSWPRTSRGCAKLDFGTGHFLCSATKRNHEPCAFEEHAARAGCSQGCPWHGVPISPPLEESGGLPRSRARSTQEDNLCSWVLLARPQLFRRNPTKVQS